MKLIEILSVSIAAYLALMIMIRQSPFTIINRHAHAILDTK